MKTIFALILIGLLVGGCAPYIKDGPDRQISSYALKGEVEK
jgi:hypothetical protein